MADETEATFKAYFDGAVTARRKGAWAVAKKHFLEAGAVMVRLGQKAITPEKRIKCEGLAVQMKDAAADCDAAIKEGRKPPEPTAPTIEVKSSSSDRSSSAPSVEVSPASGTISR